MKRLNYIGTSVVAILTLVLALSACEPRERRTRTTIVLPPDPSPAAPAEVDRLRELTLNLQTPTDRYDEADALRRLRSYLAQRNMTYTLRAVRTDNETPVDSPSVATAPLRATMEIFHGRESLYTFTFTPRDNRNLALLGH